jgi:hypothetical protein
MTANSDAGISSPDTLHPEGLYAFRFDLNGDANEDVVFKFRFGDPQHSDSDEHAHLQTFQLLRTRNDRVAVDDGELLLEGRTGETQPSSGGYAFVGIVPELWTADAFAFFGMLNASYAEDRFDEIIFQHKENLFKNRNVTAIVLEVPSSTIGSGKVGLWGTISLYGHAPETQVSRWGFPLFTHLFLSNPSTASLVEKYHATGPSQDRELFGPAIANFTSKLTDRAGSTADPEEHGRQVSARLCPSMLPYYLATEAIFNRDVFNGRPLGEDAFDVMLTLAANKPIAAGVAPDLGRMRRDFPFTANPIIRQSRPD